MNVAEPKRVGYYNARCWNVRAMAETITCVSERQRP